MCGTYGAIIGVSDINNALKLYQDILDHDEIVYDVEGTFEDLSSLPGSFTATAVPPHDVTMIKLSSTSLGTVVPFSAGKYLKVNSLGENLAVSYLRSGNISMTLHKLKGSKVWWRSGTAPLKWEIQTEKMSPGLYILQVKSEKAILANQVVSLIK